MRFYIAFVSLCIVLMLVPTLWSMQWRTSWGVPEKWFGLVYLEIDASACMQHGRPGSKNLMWEMMCGAFVEKTYKKGPMSWEEYHHYTCRDAVLGDGGMCALDQMGIMDALGATWNSRCDRVRQRCHELHMLKYANYITLFLVVLTQLLSFGALLAAMSGVQPGEAGSPGYFATASCIPSTLVIIVYGWWGMESFAGIEDTEGGHLSSGAWDTPHLSWAFLVACIACLGTYVNMSLAACVDDDDEPRSRRGGRRRSSDRREVELVAVVQVPGCQPMQQPLPPFFQAPPGYGGNPPQQLNLTVNMPGNGGGYAQQPFNPSFTQQPYPQQPYPQQQYPQYH